MSEDSEKLDLGSVLSIIYSSLYGVIMLVLVIYMFIYKKQSGSKASVIGLILKAHGLIMTTVEHILDTGSDIGVLVVYYVEMKKEIDGIPSETADIPGVNMAIFFAVSVIIFVGYRIKSGFDVYRVTKSWIRCILQTVFDAEIFTIVYINLKLGEYEPIGLLKYYRGEEALFESAVQSIIQFVFLLLTNGITDPVIYVSFIFSLSSTVGYIQAHDSINCTEYVTDGFSIKKLLCCCKKKKKKKEENTEKQIELNIEQPGNENQTENETQTKTETETETDKKEDNNENKEDGNKEDGNKEDGSEKKEEKEDEIESNCICCSREWIVETIFRYFDVVSRIFLYSIIWAFMGVYWFLLVFFIELIILAMLITKKTNAWAWEYLYLMLGIAVFPERSRPEDTLLSIDLCCIKNYVTKKFWILQFIERFILIIILTIFIFSPFSCGKSEVSGCVPYELRQNRAINSTFGLVTYIIVCVSNIIICPLLFKCFISKYILPCKADHKITISNNINECIFHHDIIGTKAMLLYGVDPNVYDEAGVTPLWTACTDGNMEAIKLLFEQPTLDPNRPMNNAYKSCCIHASCIRNQEKILELFVNNPKIDVNVIDARGATPLDAAVYYDKYYGKDHTKNIAALRAKNAKYNIFNDNGDEPEFDKFCVFWLKKSGMILTEAANQGYKNFIKEYMEKKEEMNKKYGKIDVEFRNRFLKRFTALEAAANKGHTEICEILLKNGWKKDSKGNEFKKTPEELARDAGFEDCANFINSFVK